MATSIDPRQVERWLTQGLSLHKIADRLHLPWTTFFGGSGSGCSGRPRRRSTSRSTSTHVTPSTRGPRRDPARAPGHAARSPRSRPVVARAQVAPGGPRDTERWTVHVDTRWIAAVKEEAAAEGVPIMSIVDRAFRHYFEGR